ncbi:hypothetical protein EX30DRAFT_343307 [Ascodesmis nigricans]|uniref:HD/PDEase domain-containing protein n=1 Tax=Ascodesmis nigricans TaxID=341454 RepID=A0A4S2MMZ9_9PEZI|nr:hypothetical protein EX30DRAFT_343307 [Ascodesmis nigricans]
MSQNDCSHDYPHILRVLTLSRRLTRPSDDPTLITLSALLHDIADAKYIPANSTTHATPKSFLLSVSCPASIAAAVDTICSHVSYSKEIKNPARVQEVLKVYPELAVVQDADRLDAIGAVGIGRCFAFGGAMKRVGGLKGCVDHFGEKLMRLEGMMKTELGRELAGERTRRVREFERWWREELGEVEVKEGDKEKKWDVEDSYEGFENV